MITEKGIWMTKDLTDTHIFDEQLAKAIIDIFFRASEAVDIGCGNGAYTEHLNKNAMNCTGFDGSPLTPELTENKCKVKDFSVPVDIGMFNLVISLEVGEHIPSEYEQVFIDNICRAANSYIILSWATPGQGGNGHYNERTNEYVIQEMTRRGLAFNQKLSERLRKKSTVQWFKNTLMVFKRETPAVTAIFFSCKRLEILKNTVDRFVQANTMPLREIIIVNDSGDPAVHELLKQTYPADKFTLVLHPENVGLIKSIDLGYEHIKTNYFFHCEDDWTCLGKGGFLEKSLTIMEARPEIEEVWLAHYNAHPLEADILQAGDVQYRMVGHDGPWHGFTTACGLKRISDYKKTGPYSNVLWEKTIWHRECAIGLEYFKLGYRTAILMEDYVVNTGLGKSEYITGYEK